MSAKTTVLRICAQKATVVMLPLPPNCDFEVFAENDESCPLEMWLKLKTGPVGALLGPNLNNPIRTARQIHALFPLCQLIFLRDEASAPELERALRSFILTGAHWVMLNTEHPRLAQEISEQVVIGERRRRHRVTLDKINLRVDTGPFLDALAVQRLAVSERFLTAIVEHSADAIVALSPSRQIVAWNGSAEQIWQTPASRAIGQNLTDFFDEPSRAGFVHVVDSVASDHLFGRVELTSSAPSGAQIILEVTVAPALDRDQSLIGFSVIARDIAERKAAQRDIEAARDSALAASQAKDNFLAALSHELRTPLNPALLIASEAAINPAFGPEARGEFATIRDHVQLEACLIDDLLDLTRIARGKIALKLEAVDVHSTLQEALAIVNNDVLAKGIGLTISLNASRHILQADSVRLQQVFWNLLKNAVKFTPEGGKIEVSTLNRDNEGRIVIRVKDNGIGMTPSELGRAFQAFEQGNHAVDGRAHQFGGLGLGLAISQMLIRLHGGEIHGSSSGLQQGSTFDIDLPAALAATNVTAPPESSQIGPSEGAEWTDGERILLVEDHQPTRLALKNLLVRRKYYVAEAGTLAEAQRMVAGGSFTLLLSDIGLPDGTGYDLMAEVKSRYGLRGIAMTGYGAFGDIVKSAQAGFSEHLTKPVRIEALENALMRIRTRASRVK